MWSGPRNLSTALLRAFENRPDTEVWDEPFYGHYLHHTRLPHPGAEEVIRAQGTDWQAIAQRCTAPGPQQRAVFYQKHITLHLLPHIARDWLSQVTNCFLIREPQAVVASYHKVRAEVNLADLGYTQQADLFDWITATNGQPPLVIDSRDFLQAPAAMLKKICPALGIPFHPNMLKWPPGPRPTDGVWAQHWYQSVWQSSGFLPYRPPPQNLPPPLTTLAHQAQPYYEHLYQHRLRVSDVSG